MHTSILVLLHTLNFWELENMKHSCVLPPERAQPNQPRPTSSSPSFPFSFFLPGPSPAQPAPPFLLPPLLLFSPCRPATMLPPPLPFPSLSLSDSWANLAARSSTATRPNSATALLLFFPFTDERDPPVSFIFSSAPTTHYVGVAAVADLLSRPAIVQLKPTPSQLSPDHGCQKRSPLLEIFSPALTRL